MTPSTPKERVEALVIEVNLLFGKKGGKGLQVRVIPDEARGTLFVRTDLVAPDGARTKRQESPELTPEAAVAYLQNLKAALQRS